jgi:hypothetical protein
MGFFAKIAEKKRIEQEEKERQAAKQRTSRATGVEQVMWSATLDMVTCPECGDLDGKFWGINEDHPEPPLHPNCRCCLCNVPPIENWSPSLRRDNETHEIIPYQTYNEWKRTRQLNK